MQGSLERNIVRCLDKTGIRHASSGYRYLVECIKTILNSDSRVFKVRDVYESVAGKTVKWTTIERAIRLTIKRSSRDDIKKLTNKEFISVIVDQLIP